MPDFTGLGLRVYVRSPSNRAHLLWGMFCSRVKGVYGVQHLRFRV